PTGNNWTLTAYDPDGFELDLTFSTTTPGSLVGFTGGTIVSGQVLDPEGGFNIFEGFSGTISPSPTSGSPVPEPSSLTLLALGFLSFGFARMRGTKPQVPQSDKRRQSVTHVWCMTTGDPDIPDNS